MVIIEAGGDGHGVPLTSRTDSEEKNVGCSKNVTSLRENFIRNDYTGLQPSWKAASDGGSEQT